MARRSVRRLAAGLAAGVLAISVVAACSTTVDGNGTADVTPTSPSVPSTSVSPSAVPSASAGLGANDDQSSAVSIAVAFTGPALDHFKSDVSAYAQAQGITVSFQSYTDLDEQILLRSQAGNAPDIALIPRSGTVRTLARNGKLADLGKVLDVGALTDAMVPGIASAGTVDGTVYALPPTVVLKSLVFYPKKAWTALKLRTPTSLASLYALSAQLTAAKRTPWCMGIESGPATGWAATDWLEELVLILNGPKVYNAWIEHTIPFRDPRIQAAATAYLRFFATPGWVHGGRASIATTNFATAGNALFTSPPGCYLYKQGSFIAEPGLLPSAALADVDANIGVFGFPGQTPGASYPVEGGGDLGALFSGRKANAVKIMKYLLSPQFPVAQLRSGSLLSPFRSANASLYPNQLTRDMAAVLDQASAFVYDASDQMPGAVGSGAFWRQMTAWIAGTTDLGSALAAIDRAWP